MPQITLPVPEVYLSITRPVVEQVVQDIMRTMGVYPDTEIRFIGEGKALASKLTPIDDDKRLDRLPTDRRIEIDVEEDYNEDFNRSSITLNDSNLFLFSDPTTGTDIKAAYQQMKTNITFRFKGEDKIIVNSLLKTWRRKITQALNGLVHVINYHYPLPDEFLAILTTIYDLREKQSGYGDTLAQYFKKYFSSNVGLVTNLAGSVSSGFLGVKEQGVQAISYFANGDDTPKKDRETDSGSWFAELNITLHYDRCENMVMTYPIIVHNQPMPNELLPIEQQPNLQQQRINPSLSHVNYNKYRYDRPNSVNDTNLMQPISVPSFDDWAERYKMPRTEVFLRHLTGIDPNDKQAVINLTDLDGWQFGDAAIAFLKKTHSTLARPGANIFNLTLHKNDDLLNIDLISVDQDLNVRFNRDLNLRDVHHLVIALSTDPSTLSDEVKRALQCTPEFLKSYLNLFDLNIANLLNMDFSDIDPNDDVCLTDDAFGQVMDQIEQKYELINTGKLNRKTQSFFTVIVHRSN